MLQKLKSRKFWMALLSVAAGVVYLITGDSGLEQAILSIGAIVVPVVVYILTEGKVDAKAVELSADALQAILAELKKGDEENG